MRRPAMVVLFTLLACAAPAQAHDHAGEGGWSVLQSGPRLGLPADEVLRSAPIRGGAVPPLGKFERLALQGGPRGQVGEPAGESLPPRAGDGFTVQLHHTGVEAAEPTLGVTSKGTVFFVGFGGLQVSTIVRSRDGGRTWEPTNPVTPIEGDTTSFDPYLHVDQDTDRVFNADLSLVACSVVSTSDDEGETFPAKGEICQHTDHQNLFTGPPPEGTPAPVGYPNVVYYCAIDGGAFFNYGTFTACSRSLDGGTTWVRTGAPAFTDDPTRTGGHYGVQGHCGGNVAHGTVGRDGTVYLPRGFCDRPYLAISKDQGVTWERVQVADLGMAVGSTLEEHESSVAVDAENNLYYAWIATDRLPYMVTSRDGGKTWSKPAKMVDDAINEAWNVVLEVGDPGRIAFSFIGTTNSPGGPFCTKTTADGCVTDAGEPGPSGDDYEAKKTAWHGYMGVALNALDAQPTFRSTTVNDPATPLMRNIPCGPSRCDAQFDFLDIDVAKDGTAWAAFVDKRCDPDPEAPCPEAEGAVGHLTGAPLKGPLPPPAPVVPVSPGPPLGSPPAKPRKCLKGRRLKLRVPRRTVRVTANGRRIKVGKRRRVNVDLRRIGRNRKLTVKIVVRTRAGRRTTTTKRYRTCA